MKIEGSEYVLMALAIGASVEEVKLYLEMVCGWTTISINTKMGYLVKKKLVDQDYGMTELGDDKIRSLVEESGRDIRFMLSYTQCRFSSISEVQWISEQEHFD